MDRANPAHHVTIRPRRETDFPGAASTLATVHAADGYPVEGVDQPEAWLNPAGALEAWVAENLEGIVGHVSVSHPRGEECVDLYLHNSHTPEHDVAVLARLFVHPAARRNSAGESLVRTAMEWAQSRKIRLVLDVISKDTAAIRLYERLGWQKLGFASHAFGVNQQASAVCYVSPILNEA